MLIRVLAAVAGLVLAAGTASATAQTGCGGLLQPACTTTTAPPATTTPPPATTTVPPATTPAPPPPPTAPLSAERFAAIEGVLSASVAYDDGRPSTSERATYKRVCAALSTADPLLAAYRRVCQIEQVFLFQDRAGVACRTKRSCATAITRVGRTFRTIASLLRARNAAVTSEVPDAGCAAGLRANPADIAYLDRSGVVIGRLGAAFRSGSDRRIRAAGRALDRAPTRRTRTNEQELASLRASCR